MASTVSTVWKIPFKVDLIAETAAPEGSQGPWHRYIISQGSNTITGARAGTHAEVRVQLDEMVDRLNDRRLGNRPKR